MKRFLSTFLILTLFLFLTVSCSEVAPMTSFPQKDQLRLSSFVGVWTNKNEDRYYRFTTTGLWYCYNGSGQVEGSGEVEFDGKTFNLVADDGQVERFTVDQNAFKDDNNQTYHRTDSPSSLITSSEYENFFHSWYEESNLEGNVLTLTDPDLWVLINNKNEILFEGTFYAYVEEPDCLYLYHKKDGSFYGELCLSETGLSLKQTQNNRLIQTEFATQENSTVRHIYFKDKGVECNYDLDSGFRLLRNGGAAYNDEHDYKKMPVTCSIVTEHDELDENGLRDLQISVIYNFKRTDLPYLDGGRLYNSVRFSQYDYYTGQLFDFNDTTVNENHVLTWVTEHDGISYQIECEFSCVWEYFQSDELLGQFKGTYRFTMPKDYDGFVICLRPVFNSYSAQVSSSTTPVVGTFMMEDLGEDMQKSIFCRIPKFAPQQNIQ